MSIKELNKIAEKMGVQDHEICEIIKTNNGLKIKLQEKDKYNFHFISI